MANAVVGGISLIFARRVQQHSGTKHGHRGPCSSQRWSVENEISSTALSGAEESKSPHPSPNSSRTMLKMKTQRHAYGSQQEREVQGKSRPLKSPHGVLMDCRKINFKGHLIKADLVIAKPFAETTPELASMSVYCR